MIRIEELKSKHLKRTIIERFNELSLEEQSELVEDCHYDEINNKGISELFNHLSDDDKSELTDELFNIMENIN